MPLRPLVSALAASAALAGALAAPTLAQADVQASTNWSGYAVHRSGVKFRAAVGEWTEPPATCAAGKSTASAFWVGIGGYSQTSPALDQDGTELDCKANGQTVMYAWYEFFPKVAVRIRRMTVSPGDRMGSEVLVRGKKVTLKLDDLTRRESFSITRHESTVDRTSAEWIAEAPEECIGDGGCRIQRLTDFGTVGFSSAFVQTTKYVRGTIASADWNTTEVDLRPEQVGRGEATPSSLADGGSAFNVTYSTVSEDTRGDVEGGRAGATLTPTLIKR